MRVVLVITLIILNTSVVFTHTDRNVFKIYLTESNELLVRGKQFDFEKLKDAIKEFTTNYDNSPLFAELRLRNINHIGETLVSKAVVSIQCDRNTNFQYYLKIQNEVEKAYNEVRNETAILIFGKSYHQLEKKYKKSIDLKIPKRISEAEPIYIRKNKKLIKNK